MNLLNLRRMISLVALGSVIGLSSFSGAHASIARTDSPFTSAARPVIQIDNEAPGVPYVGETLEAKTIYYGGWNPSPTTMRYTWLADGKAIKKATSTTYTLSSRDVGKSISVRVVGSLASYVTTTRVSDPTEDVSAGQDFQVASTPTITGTASVGQMLTSSVNPLWSAHTITVMYSYQWLRSGKPIKGATDYYYWLTSKDAGKTVSVRWTGSAPTHLTTSRTSLSTAIVTG
jgi:hypothetical protein